MPIVLKPHELKLRQQAGEYDEPTCIRGASGVYYGTEEPEDYQINVWVNPEGTVTKTMESPILTGIPTAPTASPHTDTTQIATTEFVMNEVENKIESTDIVDNLTTNDSSKPLSAAQGYSLNNNKVNKTDIADNLTTNDATKVLSAAQGYVLKNEIDGLDEEKAPKQNPVFTGSISLGRKANTTVGIRSLAFGNDVEASNMDSQAFGNNTIASGYASHSEGTSTTASGAQSHAEGISTTASGNNSHSEGSDTIASGVQSHAEGQGTKASNQNAHAEGYYTTASGTQSHAEGNATTSSGLYSHSEGVSTVAAGNASHAEGQGGTYTFYGTTYTSGAKGTADHSEGYQCLTESNMPGNHAEGYWTRATGGAAHSEGYWTLASGLASHAEGASTVASQNYAHAEGQQTVAAGASSHVSGQFNVEDSYSNWSEWVANTSYSVGDKVKRTSGSSVSGYICKTANSDSTFTSGNWTAQNGKMNYAEIIGNGLAANNKSNARALDWDGNEYLKGDLYVGCNADSTGGEKVATEEYADSKVTYVTPEDFGAKGDGTTDDTTAVQAALDYGRTNGVSVKGFKRYKTTSPLAISGSYQDIFIRVISYTGNECAMYIRGTYHNLRFMQIYCSNGAGVVFKADTANIYRCRFSAMRIFAKNNSVTLQADGNWILYNTFEVRDIKSDTGNCFHSTGSGCGENVFMNSSCACQNGWAIYRADGRYYNFTLEGDVKNGIWIEGGYSYFAGFRYRELTDKLVRRENGIDPNAVGGTLIKYYDCHYCVSKFVGEDAIPYDAIDVSEMSSPESGAAEQSPEADKLARLSLYHVIDAPIRYGNWDTVNGFHILGNKMIVHGGRKICIPVQKIEYTISTSTYDMRDAQVALNAGKIYPSKMIIGVDNCVIYLPASYNPEGYSEFIVDQSLHTCTIYDYNDTTTPIFNGSSLETGVYRLKAVTDLTNNVVNRVYPQRTIKFFDSSNYKWEIEKIDQTGGGGSNCGVVNVSDYGAVGDGTTDDSAAIQLACDAGYDIYFESDKTYYLASQITIRHDVRLHGGKNTVIKTESVTSGGETALNLAFFISGTLKKTTTMTSNYATDSNAVDNTGNKFTFADMDGINVGDLIEIVATDQYYSYARQYYYLGAMLMVGDVYDGHIYTTCDMPWDITNSANVTVKVYSAPEVTIENLHFESDYAQVRFKFAVEIERCKNIYIKGCTFDKMWNGVRLYHCFNSKVNSVIISNMKYDNNLSNDSYGICIESCTNTIVEQINSICAQGCVELTGTIPNINTFIRNCNANGECRLIGIDMHENAYNTVIEDCELGGLSLFGTATLNRCRIIRNVRVAGAADSCGVAIRGSHNPNYARYKISNCEFYGNNGYISLTKTLCQTPIQSFANIIGDVLIENIVGGSLYIYVSSDSNITSNVFERVVVRNWRKCNEIYRTATNTVRHMEVIDCEFTKPFWINPHSDAFAFGGIEYLRVKNEKDSIDKLFVSTTSHGEKRRLPIGTKVTFSSSDTSAHYTVCGKNIASNDPSDYNCGSVSGSTGSAPTRTVDSNFNNALSVNSNGNLVFDHPSSTATTNIYAKSMFYVSERCNIKASVVAKDTGSSPGSKFSIYILIVNGETGLITYRDRGSVVEATAQGATVTFSRSCGKNNIVTAYIYNNTGVSGSQTTFEDFVIEITPSDIDEDLVYEEYHGSSRDGDGVLYTEEGLNWIGCSTDSFSKTYKADFIS